MRHPLGPVSHSERSGPPGRSAGDGRGYPQPGHAPTDRCHDDARDSEPRS